MLLNMREPIKDFNNHFPTVRDKSDVEGIIKLQPNDFVVKERIDIPFSGEGEHLWLYVEKSCVDTEWVARQLSRLLHVSKRQVGYAGLKDKHAVTQQWFSIQLPDRLALENFEQKLPQSIRIIDQQWHNKKLKRGNLFSNYFNIVLRDLESAEICDVKRYVDEQLLRIIEQGIPNYFGPQRFGKNFNNMLAVEAFFNGEKKPKSAFVKGMYLSSARAWLFNHILAERIIIESWNQAVAGDVYQLDGSRSYFIEKLNDNIIQRVKEMDIHPTGALWGNEPLLSSDLVAELENKIGVRHQSITRGVNQHIKKQDRRALRIQVKGLSHTWVSDNTLVLKFNLPAGSYATSVIREIINYADVSVRS